MTDSLAPYWVTAGGVVHAAGCQHLRRSFSSVWAGSNRLPHDRACLRCLAGDLPEAPR